MKPEQYMSPGEGVLPPSAFTPWTFFAWTNGWDGCCEGCVPCVPCARLKVESISSAHPILIINSSKLLANQKQRQSHEPATLPQVLRHLFRQAVLKHFKLGRGW